MVGTTALVRVTIGYINLLFGLKALNIISKECLVEIKNIFYVPFTCGVKSKYASRNQKTLSCILQITG